MYECKPLPGGTWNDVIECLAKKGNADTEEAAATATLEYKKIKLKGRGLHSSTFQLNLSALYGTGNARRDCEARVKGVLGGVQGVWGVLL